VREQNRFANIPSSRIIELEERSFARAAGTAALAAFIAWLVWAAVNWQTSGGLDAGQPFISARFAAFGNLLTVAQNLFLLPAAIVFRSWMAREKPHSADLYTLCGVAAITFWAYAAASATNNATVEATYLCLSGFWWLGIGQAMRGERKVFGWLSIILAAFAFWDATVTYTNAPLWLFLTAAPKLPLSWIWDLWVGIMLLRESTIPPDNGILY
jgi:hypothetical protein